MIRRWVITTALLCTLGLPLPGTAATKENQTPDREMLKMMEFLRQMELIKQIDMLREMDRLENGAAAVPQKVSPTKKPETPK